MFGGILTAIPLTELKFGSYFAALCIGLGDSDIFSIISFVHGGVGLLSGAAFGLGDGPPCLFYGEKGWAGELGLIGRRQGPPVPSPLGSMTGEWLLVGPAMGGVGAEAGAVLARRSGRVGPC